MDAGTSVRTLELASFSHDGVLNKRLGMRLLEAARAMLRRRRHPKDIADVSSLEGEDSLRAVPALLAMRVSAGGAWNKIVPVASHASKRMGAESSVTL